VPEDDFKHPRMHDLPKKCPECGLGFPPKSVTTVAGKPNLLEVTLECANCGHRAVMTTRSI
jgi:ribosomal protein S27AE